MNNCIDKKHDKDNRSFVGIIFLVIGLILLGRNFDFIPYHISHIIFSWPSLLIVIGVLMITMKKKSIGGLFMIGMGTIFLWDRLYPFSPMDWKIAWPAVFIFVGLALVIGYINKPSRSENNRNQMKEPQSKKQKKGKWDDVEFDIDKIEPIED